MQDPMYCGSWMDSLRCRSDLFWTEVKPRVESESKICASMDCLSQMEFMLVARKQKVKTELDKWVNGDCLHRRIKSKMRVDRT
jgi:hypothetical protein